MSGFLWPLLTRRQVLETHSFTEQLSKIGHIQRLDEVLAPVQLILTENAEVFPLVRGHKKIRIATTRAINDVPALFVWFMIEDADSVLLLFVEPVPVEA